MSQSISNCPDRLQTSLEAPIRYDAYMRLVVLRGKRVINRTQARPFVWHWVRLCDAGYLLGQGDGEASLEVEVDVAVEEPGTGIVRPEADRDVVVRGGCTGRDGVAPDGVAVVVRGRAGTSHHREDMLSGVVWSVRV